MFSDPVVGLIVLAILCFTLIILHVPQNVRLVFIGAVMLAYYVDYELHRTNHALQVATRHSIVLENRNVVLENQKTYPVEDMEATWTKLRQCIAERHALRGVNDDWWAQLKALEDDPVLIARVMDGASERLKENIWAIGERKRREEERV